MDMCELRWLQLLLIPAIVNVRRWFVILATGYVKSHGLIPDGDVSLTYENWGALTQIGFNGYISNERACIMIAHIHALGVSAAAALGPQVLGDTLTLVDGESDEVIAYSVTS